MFRVFVFLFFSCCYAELASIITTQNNPWNVTILPGKPTIWRETRDKIDVHKYPYRGLVIEVCGIKTHMISDKLPVLPCNLSCFAC